MKSARPCLAQDMLLFAEEVFMFRILFVFLMVLPTTVLATADRYPSTIKGIKSDRSMTDKDAEITRQIRQKINANGALSSQAQNVGIDTKHGHVNLTGTVRTRAEEQKIIEAARAVAGHQNVQSHMQLMRAD